MGYRTLLCVLALVELQLLIDGQWTTMDHTNEHINDPHQWSTSMIHTNDPHQWTTAEPSSNDSNVHYELADQLIEIHREIIKMQMSINDSQRNPVDPPGGLQSLTQQVNRMLIYALPGVLGRTVGMVEEGNFAFLGANDKFDGESDYQLSQNIKQSVRKASSTVRSMSSPFFKSLETLQVISSNLMPATEYHGAESVYRGCHDAFLKGARTSGVYSIMRDRHVQFRAWCDFDEQGGWTVIQRRFDGTVNFARPWEQYVNGFGSLWGEYWLGLRAIHHLTQGTVRLSIYFEDNDRNRHTLTYSSFAVGDVSTNYRLHVGGYYGGLYDSMAPSNGSAFSTWDQDRDGWGDNCALRSSGGWWFYSSCSSVNPNGRYDDGPESVDWRVMAVNMGPWTRMSVVAMRINV